jgi:2-polyprenyl-3-methyl-5-hydroxy-6-metoxy-1,4-benzoquinol methylase
VYKKHGCGPYWGFEAGEDATPEPVFAIASGFMMARVSAIRAIMAKNPGVPVWADSQAVETATAANGEEMVSKLSWGHDIRFCKLMWEAGYEVHVDGRVLCDHFDITTQKTFRLPQDSEPFRRAKNINKKSYWDQVYSYEGADTWRKYPEMFDAIADIVDEDCVVEVGCGVGLLGSKLTAEGRTPSWIGFDISETAVDMAKSRFLNAHCAAVKDLTPDNLRSADVVIATELVEHLDEADVKHLFSLVKGSGAHTFIFTVPDNCMPPEEVPEHQRTYTSEQVMDLVEELLPGWSAMVTSGDAKHLLATVTLNER